jgi:hypothetical protein
MPAHEIGRTLERRQLHPQQPNERTLIRRIGQYLAVATRRQRPSAM